jgi:hypothetical protein
MRSKYGIASLCEIAVLPDVNQTAASSTYPNAIKLRHRRRSGSPFPAAPPYRAAAASPEDMQRSDTEIKPGLVPLES